VRRSLLAGLALAVYAHAGNVPGAIQVTAPAIDASERAQGFQVLFDGATLAGWRGFSSLQPTGWRAAGGVLAREGKGEGHDIMTVAEYADFDLRLEWKISEGGNSGIFFHVTTEGPYVWSTGPEFQVLDNARHADGKEAKTSAGSNYALHAPLGDVTKPVGEWNLVRLLVRGPHVEHWLNGVKLLEYELWSPDWEARVKASKFAVLPSYGRAKIGHIALQDHGNPVWFRNIRIRVL